MYLNINNKYNLSFDSRTLNTTAERKKYELDQSTSRNTPELYTLQHKEQSTNQIDHPAEREYMRTRTAAVDQHIETLACYILMRNTPCGMS